jgi:holo-[acyl-carrier protein] synthase
MVFLDGEARLSISVGVDTIEIDRVERVLARYGDRFLKRVFTPREIEYCMGRVRPAPSLAARFAAKEAFYKAATPLASASISLYFHWREAEVLRGKGAPTLSLDGVFKEIMKGRELSLSLSHSKTHAIAVVVISGG